MTVEIVVGKAGIQRVRVMGQEWSEAVEGNAMLLHLHEAIEQLDRSAKEFGRLGERLIPPVC